MNQTFEYHIKELPQVAQKIVDWLPQNALVCFTGGLGVGKTTLTKAIIEILAGRSAVSSPTFTFINEYSAEDSIIYHLDCYRIRNTQDAIQTGILEIIDTPHWRFVEWSENIKELLPENYLEIQLENLELNLRRISLIA